ncbi:hypothetical protein K493DRAFT_302750 [Basidiobolus meristosporus CBS 931.73]|uniref:N-formylglutamate amidohydrolase n=1 Tax=Basidiobolus meristosporus CBS 931.73 TaxID=1314790 RepID=A0A1Y1Y5N0_9FUNG|nr:hypothetical protein K493DRAFT_302750 [Basidiobolus meristosporus CBS 931.73]|eukprot:ORX93331.1 hypothetical protein K493DRAFT_302750 [Basidiobolus meristosporus CBS 931.73]
MKQVHLESLLANSLLKDTCPTAESIDPGAISKFTSKHAFPKDMPTTDYVEYIPGNFPLVISASHGGYLDPAEFPERRKSPNASLLGDLHTQEIARLLVEYLGDMGKRPYLVICHLRRSKVDMNRRPGSLAYDNTKAAEVYFKYHARLSQACEEIQNLYGTGIYLDIHGQRHPQNWIELGYLLNSSELEHTDQELDSYAGPFSLSRLLARHPNTKIGELLRGDESFGGLLESLGYKTVPSPQHPSPSSEKYYRGGYCTYRYWKVGGLDTLQVELPASIRFDLGNRKKFIRDLAQVILGFGNRWYEWNRITSKI